MVNLKTQRRNTSMMPFVSRLARRNDDFPTLMRRFLGEDFPSDVFAQPVSWMPPVDVTETDQDIKIVTELPGLSEDDVEIDFDDDVLTISGEKSEERKEEQEGRRYHVFERTYGSFRRSFSLPSNVDAAKISAEFRNGVLTVMLPKTETERSKGRKIPIGATK